jgi:hypothetical protein
VLGEFVDMFSSLSFARLLDTSVIVWLPWLRCREQIRLIVRAKAKLITHLE